MASTRTILRAAAERLVSPGEVLRRANEVLCPDMPPKMFVTCLCAALDPLTGHIQYANAGHNAPQQRTQDGIVELRARGMPLGLMPGMQYEERETRLAPGDTLLLYSDGYIEAHNPERAMFGLPRLQTLIKEHTSAETLISHLRDALFAFTGHDWEQEDDVTFVVIGREERSQQAPREDSPMLNLDEFEIASEPGGERAVMERVAQSASLVNLPPARIERLKTAVAEATMNAMEHGNQYRPDLPVKIRVAANDETLNVFVTDHGGSQPVPEMPSPDIEAKLAGLQSPRGWGLFLIKAMVDDMNVYVAEGEHTVELVLKLEGN